MQPRESLLRLAAPMAAAVLVTLMITSPAFAQRGTRTATWVSPTTLYSVNIAKDLEIPRPLKITIENLTARTAYDVVVRIDTTQLPDTFRAALPGPDEGCTVADKVATCTMAQLGGDSTRDYTIKLLPGDREAEETRGRITVTSGAANTPGERQAETFVYLVEPGADLALNPVQDIRLAPGAEAAIPYVIRNTGSITAEHIVVRLDTFVDYLELPSMYSNCQPHPDSRNLICVFDQPIKPGETVTIDPKRPLKVRVAERTPGPNTYEAAAAVIPVIEKTAAKAHRSTGTELRLIPIHQAGSLEDIELNFDDNIDFFHVTVPKSAADSTAVGAMVTGKIGQTKTVKVGVRNKGPADRLAPLSEWDFPAKITLPAGLQVLAIENKCVPMKGDTPAWEQQGKPGGLSYYCRQEEQVLVGNTYTLNFKVKITDKPSAAGVITIAGGIQDDNLTNDSAPITLMLAAAGQGGGEGGLPITGDKTGVMIGCSLLLIFGGAVVFFLARHRRIVTVTSEK